VTLAPAKAPAPVAPETAKPAYEQIDQLIAKGGHIMIGTILPLRNAAVAHDGTQTIVMLRCKPKEPLEAILARVNTAVAKAQATGQRVDEVNRPGAAHTYKI